LKKVNNQLKKYKKREVWEKKHIWKKNGSRQGSPGSWVDRRVNRVFSGFYFGRSFVLPGPVSPPGWPGPESTCRAGPGLITMVWKIEFANSNLCFRLWGCNHHHLTKKHPFYKDQLLLSYVYVSFSSTNSTTCCPRLAITAFLNSRLIRLTLSNEWMSNYIPLNWVRLDPNKSVHLFYQDQVVFNDNDIRVVLTRPRKWLTQSSMVVISISQTTNLFRVFTL